MGPLPTMVIHRLLLLFLFLRASADTDCDTQYNQLCGGIHIKYPLWLKKPTDDPAAPLCGHPDLGIDCEDNTPLLRSVNDVYVIANVSYNEGIVRVKDRDLITNDCPRPKHNLTLNETLLVPRNVAQIFFYFGCSNPDNNTELVPLICLGNGAYAGFEDETGRLYDCENHVISPVNRRVSEADLYREFGGLLKEGFDVGFNANVWKNCSDCEGRRGTCAYTWSRRNLSYAFDCQIKRGGNTSMKILIGVAAGIGGVLLACVFCILYRRKKPKTMRNSSKLRSLVTSSDGSSRKDLEGGDDLISGTPFFRYEELYDATSGFSPCNELGEGGFGTVYKGKLKDGRVVAVKRLYENNFKRVEQFMNEVLILNRLRHPNLVSLYGCTSRHSRELLLVYEYVQNGTVADHLHGDLAPQHALTWPLRLAIATETAAAVTYLHAATPPIIHRDIKTHNILLDAEFHVKVADFGLSRLYPVAATHVSTAPQGTPGYVDPDYHRFYQLTDKSDVYSFGVVLVELISSLPAVDLGRRRDEVNLSNMALERIQSGRLDELIDPKLGCNRDPEIKRTVEVVAELAFRCLQGEKEMRPTMEEAFEVLLAAQDSRRPSEDGTVPDEKVEEMGLIKTAAVTAPRSPISIMDTWVSRTTTPSASG